MAFSLTDRQIEQRDAAASNARHVLGYGGSRSGKTFGFCYCIAARALSAPNSRHLISRLHNIDVRQAVMMDTWPNMMRLAFPGVKTDMAKQDQFATFPNGSEVWFGGLDDKERVDKILGKEYATIYVNESSQVAYQTVLVLRTRLAQNVKKSNGEPLKLKGYYDLNPTGRSHWSYKEFVKGVRPENDMPLPAGTRIYVVMNPRDNPHLSEEYLDELDLLPERQRKRFSEGAYAEEVENALWSYDSLEQCRVLLSDIPEANRKRIVIGVDPSGASSSNDVGRDEIGIVPCALSDDKTGFVLEDLSERSGPEEWARKAVNAFVRLKADSIVAEANFGGEMVRQTIKTIDPSVPVKLVHASRGKHVRAEPIATLYSQGKVKHVGKMAKLEDQLCGFSTSGYAGSDSPDHADAAIWALTELMLGFQTPPGSSRYRTRR